MNDSETIQKLRDAGYHWKYNADSYQVWHKEEYLGGASVKLPRDKPLHWKYRTANIVDNFQTVMRIIEKHAKENNIQILGELK